ncbi:O-methyltransferase, partial [Candidatus Magnetoovum chiemensis]
MKNNNSCDDIVNLRSLISGCMKSRVILTSNNLRIYDYLTSYKSAEDLSKKINTDIRATRILLDALTSLSILDKNKESLYINSPLANKYLVSTSLYYQGDIIKHIDT